MDKYLVSLAFFLLCLECGWLAEDLNLVQVPFLHNTYMSLNNESLGQITLVKRNVRKKSNSSLVWEDTSGSQKVYAYDSVLTLDQSAAEVSLNSGAHLSLHENTLVSIEPPEKGNEAGPVRLRFRRGAMSARLGRDPASVDAGDWIVEAQPQSKISVRSQGNDQFEIESHEGEVKIINPSNNQTSAVVKAGQAVVVKNEKVSEPTEVLTLDWAQPKDGERIYTHQETTKVIFEWSGKASGIAIYEPESNQGKNIPITQSVSLSTGNYAIQLSNEGLFTYARNISVWTAPKIYLLDPLPRERIRSDKAVLLSWTLNSEVASYLWQVATDENFKNIINSGETPANTAEVKNLPLGKFYWRVLGKDEMGYIIPEIYSNPFYILAKPLAAPKLKSPKIIPEDESLLFKIWNWILPQASADEVKKVPKNYKAEFLWEKVEGAGNYTIEISETPDFRTSIVAATTSTPRFIWRNFKLSEYYWRVAAESMNGELGLFSEVAKADLTTIPKGPVTAAGILTARPKPIPTPTPVPTPTPTPTPTPMPPLEPQYHPHDYAIQLGGHYIYEAFKGPDFNAQESGPFLGDVALEFKSPFKGSQNWHGEIEFERVTVKPTDPTTVPFQNSGTNYALRLTAIDQTPFKGKASWGVSVLNEYSLFERAGDEVLAYDFPILIGPFLDWRHNYNNHELHYRLGAYVGSALSVEGSATYIVLLPMTQRLTSTLSFELRAVSGVTSNASVWTSGTGFFFLGVRW